MIDETGQRILRLIDVHKDQIIAFAEDIAAHPEPGYEEFCTAGKTAEVLKNLGYKVTEHLARTGVKGTKSIKEGPSLTVIGELEAGSLQRQRPWPALQCSVSSSCFSWFLLFPS